jgi:nucleoside-diphosphate-sugar epimerase
MIAIDELADMIAKIAGKKIIKRHEQLKPQGVRGRNADISLAKSVLNWQPAVSLEAGLEITYKWIFEQLLKTGKISR